MDTQDREEFGRLLVQLVRDRAIQQADSSLTRPARTRLSERWKEAQSRGAAAFAEEIIPDIVDYTIFYLLNALDSEALKLRFTTAKGRDVDLTSSGELAGWLAMGRGGWLERYSSERWVDNFPHHDNPDDEAE
ncbi:MAG: hypothetical protein H6716_17115 [Polyangiaceae bacterium]|nr:hypothetical protein [Polyangiaceae bacterium]